MAAPEGDDPRLVGELAAFAAWDARLRRAAAALVRDSHAADDLAQEAWLAALARERPVDGSLAAWLAATVRRASLAHRRARVRRERRERAAARPEALEGGTRSLERLELHAVLLDEIRALPAIYKGVIVARYLDEFTVREIAARDGIPERTVETRLSRAHALLRTRLDRRTGRDRTTWFSAAAIVRAMTRSPALLITMTKTHTAALLVAAALLFALGIRAVVHRDAAPKRSLAAASTVIEPSLVDRSAPSATSTPSDAREVAATTPASGPENAAPSWTLRGRVVDERGDPLAGVRVHARRWPDRATSRTAFVVPLARAGSSERTAGVELAVTRSDGSFAFDVAAGAYELALRAMSHERRELPLVFATEAGNDVGEIAMARGRTLKGRVVDEDGAPIGGASLEVALEPAAHPDLWTSVEWVAAGDSEGDGFFEIGELSHGPWHLRVSADGHLGVEARGAEVGGATIVSVVMQRAFEARGSASGAIRGLSVFTRRAGYGSAHAPVEEDGTFRIYGLPSPGPWTIRLSSGPKSGHSVRSASVTVADVRTEHVHLVASPRRLVLRVVDEASGAPIAGATVVVGTTWGVMRSGTPSDADGIVGCEIFAPPEMKDLRIELRAPGFGTVHWRTDAAGMGDLDFGSVSMLATEPIAVRVYDRSTGSPIAGASIIATHDRAFSRQDASDIPQRLRARRVEGRTGADGIAELLELPPLPAHMSAYAPGFAPTVLSLGENDAAPDGIALGLGGTLIVQIVDDAGACGGAAVRLVDRRIAYGGLPMTEWISRTGDDGIARFELLAPGNFDVSIPRSDRPRESRISAPVVVGEGETHFELRLPPAALLDGVLTSGGRALAGAVVRGIGPEVPGIIGRSFGHARTDGVGRFQLGDLAPGPFRFSVEHPHVPQGTVVATTLVAGTNRLVHDVATASVTARLVDDRGAPLTDIEVALTGESDAKIHALRHTSASDASGRVRIEGLLPEIEWRWEVPGRAFAPPDESHVLEMGEERSVGTLVFPRGATISVTTSFTGTQPPFLSARVEGQARRAVDHPAHSSPRAFEIRGLAPGSATVRLLGFGLGSLPEVARRDVELRPGETVRVHFDLP